MVLHILSRALSAAFKAGSMETGAAKLATECAGGENARDGFSP